MLRQDDFNKAQLVLTGWRHGKDYGGHLASCMIMSCIMNRHRLGWDGGQLLAILDNIPKYAATADMPTGTPAIWEPQFIRLLHEVESIYDGTMDFAKGAVFWGDTRDMKTPFFKDKILSDPQAHPRVAEMNTLAVFA